MIFFLHNKYILYLCFIKIHIHKTSGVFRNHEEIRLGAVNYITETRDRGPIPASEYFVIKSHFLNTNRIFFSHPSLCKNNWTIKIIQEISFCSYLRNIVVTWRKNFDHADCWNFNQLFTLLTRPIFENWYVSWTQKHFIILAEFSKLIWQFAIVTYGHITGYKC